VKKKEQCHEAFGTKSRDLRTTGREADGVTKGRALKLQRKIGRDSM